MALPRPLQFISDHARWLYPLCVLLAAIVVGNVFGLGMAILTVGGGVLGGSIWLVWSSLQGLTGDVPLTLDEALSLGAPSAEEEQKRSVLRALKDLEYERAVGKINEEDYNNLSQHYRDEAKRLLRAVDKDLSPERERAERLLAERLAAAASGKAKAEAKAKAKAAKAAASPGAEAAPVVAAIDAEEDDAEPPPAKSPSSDTAP
jgi:hypothetical protein